MFAANSLPETLDGANVQLTARMRQDNWPTSTTDGEFSSQHRVLLDKVDTIQATIDFIRISGGAFTALIITPPIAMGFHGMETHGNPHIDSYHGFPWVSARYPW